MDLYRVGTPSIGETWPRRFSHTRSTGGLGTGVYAFREEWAAKSNADTSGQYDEFYVLHNAVQNPIQPTTEDATYAFNQLSRKLGLIAAEVERGDVTWDRVRDRGRYLALTVTGGLFGDPRVDDGSGSLGEDTLEILLRTPELKEKYGLSNEEFIQDCIDAAERASREIGGYSLEHGRQALNYLLYPDFDGICPLDGAGGNTGMWGCVILAERLEECVGESDFEYRDRISAERLNECFR